MKNLRTLIGLVLGTSICMAGTAPAASPADMTTQQYDFGVAVIGTTPVAHVFRISDMQKQPITVAQISTTCQCTTAYVGTESPTALPITLKPDEEALVHVQVDTSNLAPGPADKYVYIYLKGRTVPAYTLELSGTIRLPAPRH